MRRIPMLLSVAVCLLITVAPASAAQPDASGPVPATSCGDCYWGSYAMGKGADSALAAWNSFNQSNTCSTPLYISWRTLFLGAINEGELAESKLFQAYSASCDCQLATQGRSAAESALLYVNAALEAAATYCTQVDPWVSEMLSAKNWYEGGVDTANNCEDQSCGATE